MKAKGNYSVTLQEAHPVARDHHLAKVGQDLPLVKVDLLQDPVKEALVPQVAKAGLAAQGGHQVDLVKTQVLPQEEINLLVDKVEVALQIDKEDLLLVKEDQVPDQDQEETSLRQDKALLEAQDRKLDKENQDPLLAKADQDPPLVKADPALLLDKEDQAHLLVKADQDLLQAKIGKAPPLDKEDLLQDPAKEALVPQVGKAD